MAEAVTVRIRQAGGKLVVWAVLREDVYESRYGDRFYLHVRGVAFNSKDAHALAELAGASAWEKWHVKGYELGLGNGLPALLRSWPEFTIGDFVAILAEISPQRHRLEALHRLRLAQRWSFLESALAPTSKTRVAMRSGSSSIVPSTLKTPKRLRSIPSNSSSPSGPTRRPY